MVIAAQCLGLRVREIVALRSSYFDFEKLMPLVPRSAVKARADEVKTEYSRDEVPLHPDLAPILVEWWARRFAAIATGCSPAPKRESRTTRHSPQTA
jgi:integrase